MKIIGGRWSGRQIKQKSTPKMRPTSNKVREAVFDILESRAITKWPETRVLELFSGTGAFGIEALSRGARFVTFLDNHFPTTRGLSGNLKELEVENSTEVICKGVLDGIQRLHRRGDTYQLIFLDPPYRQDWVMASMNRLQEFPVLASRGLVVAEHDKRENLSSLEGFWKLLDARRYGDTAISFFCHRKQENYWASRFGDLD